jgi:acyl-coenzyme A synthetase/AMP-(fatty) acid ligase
VRPIIGALRRIGEAAPYKYCRWVRFVSELPWTSAGKMAGKIQRFKLRALSANCERAQPDGSGGSTIGLTFMAG